MPTTQSTASAPSANAFTDQAADTATEAIRGTQRAANHTLDNLASTVQDLRKQAAPLLHRATDTAQACLQQGMDAMQEGSATVRAQARRAADCTTRYVKDEPVKALLIAAAAGAVLAALVRVAGHLRDRR